MHTTNYKDITGMRFGRLTALEYVGTSKAGARYAMWRCKCDCGNEVVVSGHALRSGNTKSCGCYSIDVATDRIVSLNKTHGASHTRLFHIWDNMKTRCYNPNAINYNLYGGRGIKICDEWKDDFAAFERWALASGYDPNKPRTECTIDRINSDGDYSPTNCRWIPLSEQANNRRNSRYIWYHNECRTMKDWAEFFGMDYDLLCSRMNNPNYDFERAISEPKRKHSKHKNKVPESTI